MKAYSIKNETVNMEDYLHVSKNSGNVTCEFVMHDDEENGMIVKRIIYKDGSITPWHDHPCSHGMFILKGTLTTNLGTFKANDFVWWPEGERGYHGAKKGDGDCEAIFITNKSFKIRYFEENELLEDEDIEYVIHHPE